MHLIFNVIGTVLFLTIFYILNAIFDFSFMTSVVDEKSIAIVHTVFNLVTSFMLLPFVKQLEKLAYLIVKEDKNEKKQAEGDMLSLLDDRFLRTPSVAVEQTRNVIGGMAHSAQESVTLATELLYDYDEEKANSVFAMEKLVDKYEDVLGSYLVKLSSLEMSHKDAQTVSTLLHNISDLERISDHCSNIAVCLVQVNDDNFETHEYLRTVKTSGQEFDSEVEKFQKEFPLPKKEEYKLDPA